MKNKLLAIITFVFTIAITIALVIWVATINTEPAYQIGTLTKGNPDNSYLDSCEAYCCGD